MEAWSMSAVAREEFELRISVIEREAEGEKMVTRHTLEQSRRNSDDLAAIKTRLDRVEGKVDALQTTVGGLQATVNSLVRDLPKLVADAVREALTQQ
jgi:chromosome segregation ATPase